MKKRMAIFLSLLNLQNLEASSQEDKLSTIPDINKELSHIEEQVKKLECQPFVPIITARFSDYRYEISYQSGFTTHSANNPRIGGGGVRFEPVYETAILKTTKTIFTTAGKVDGLMTRKVGTIKTPLKNGFDATLPVFEESDECKQMVERGNVLIEKKSNIETSIREKEAAVREQKIKEERLAQKRVRDEQRGNNEDYIYNEKWEISYVNSYGSQVFTTIVDSSLWKLSKNIPCYLALDPQHQNIKRNKFERSIFCDEKLLGTLTCEINEERKSCSKRIGEYVLSVDIDRYLSMKARRKKALEFERNNNVPY